MAKYPLLGSLLVAILSTGLAAEQVAPIAADVAARGNLLANPGFEQGGALPARWARYPKKDERGNRHARDLTIAHDGTASGLLWSVAPHVPGKAGIQWNQYGLDVEGGSTLIACFWTHSEGGPVGTGGVHAYDKAGQHLGFTRILATSPGGHWAFARQHIPMPPEAAKIGFAAYGSDHGKVWFDDCAILGTPNAEATRATPTIDGHLDEPCWSDARAIRTFAVHPGTRLRSDGTRAWLAYDDDALYVAFRCPHPKDATLRAKATRPDGDTWLDDSIEVFLDPQHSHRDYFQFCVNCRGIVRDSHRADTGWQSGARAVAVREADEWTVELAIPYDSLRITLATGPTWGINLVRNDRVRGEVLTWSLDGFHKPGRFGNVTLRPRLRRFWLADWKRRVAQMRARERQFRGELEATGLPKATFAKVRTQLDAIGALLDRTPTASHDDQEQAEIYRTAIAEAERRLREARGAALAAVYALDGHGGDSFRVVIAHSMQKVRRDGPVLDGVLTREVRLEAARDEAESFQLVVIPNDTPLKQVTVEAPPLRGPGAALPLAWHRVGYVQTATPSYAAEFVGWWPDPLLPAAPFDVAKGQRQPLWFTVNVPQNAAPGTYKGQVSIRHEGAIHSVPVTVRVRDFTLPRPGALATAFGLYAQVLSQWYSGKKPYRDALPIEAFARWCEFLGEYRLTAKNIAREYIRVERKDDGWRADLAALDKTVAPLASRYFAPDSFCLHRLPVAGVLKREGAKHDTDAWVAITKTIADEWRRRKLPPRAYIYGMDEPREQDLPFLAALYRRVRAAAPGFPIMQTIGHPNPRELVGLVGIWCPLTPRLSSPFYAQRRKAGDTLWTYVCCGPKPPYANFFIDQPATAHRMVFWQAWQHGCTGLLYWCVCYWNGLPNVASGKPCFPDAPIRLAELGTYKAFKANGDGVLVYPGPNLTPYPSVRLEVIRDGIEDYEYLALLSRLLKQAEARPPAERPPAALLRQARALLAVPSTLSRSLTSYATEPRRLAARRSAVADMVERLTQTARSAHNAARQ